MKKLLILLMLSTFILHSSPSRLPCSFPTRCSCSLSSKGAQLRCTTMERCFNQQSMDEIAAAIRPDTCPVKQFLASCSNTKTQKQWPTVTIESRLFRQVQWRRLQKLLFGTKCVFEFKQHRLLSPLTQLESLSFVSAKLSTNLSQFSDIFCCPPKLSEILLKGLGAETGGSLIGQQSFTRCNALEKLGFVNSPSIIDRVDLVFNTTSPSVEILYLGSLPNQNTNFSSLSLTNLVNGSKLALRITKVNKQFNLDSRPNVAGFEMTVLTVSGLRVSYVGDNPFQGLSLKDITVSGAGLNVKLLHRLLSALGKLSKPELLGTISLQFKNKNETFPFDDFNHLCQSLPRLHRLFISQSQINLAVSPNRYFHCPQLLNLDLTNCKLNNDKFPPDVFRYMPNLRSIKLDGNLFSDFPKESFRYTRNVIFLSMSGNSQMNFRATSLRGILPMLRQLALSYCGISEPLTDAFIDQPELSSLTLNSMRTLREIRCPFGKTWFENCTNLKKLQLMGNKFFATTKCDAMRFFEPLKSLEELGLSNSGFGLQHAWSSRQLLNNLSSLKSLELNGNSIRMLEYFLTHRLPNLEKLTLNDNSLSGISKDLFVSMTPKLRFLQLVGNPLVHLDPRTFSSLPNLRIVLGPSRFACTCDLVPFTDWLRQQWPIYQIETNEKFLRNAICQSMPNGSKPEFTVRLIEFDMSWWDCYNRRLIVILSTSVGVLLLLLVLLSLLVKYRWKLHYNILVSCIRHHLVKRKVPTEWIYDGCFIYDETDEQVSQWVENLIDKLEADLQLRLYEPDRDAPVGANILDEAASAIDKSRHAVLVLTRGFLENRLNLYSAQWSNESLFIRRTSLAVMVMKERLSESELMIPGCKVLHRLYRMCKPDRIVDCIGCGVSSNSANRLGLMLYNGVPRCEYQPRRDHADETEPLLEDVEC